MKFSKTTIQDTILYDLRVRKEWNTIRHIYQARKERILEVTPTTSSLPLTPIKESHDPNMKQMIQIEMVRHARSGHLLLLQSQGRLR